MIAALLSWACLLPVFILFNRIRGGGMSQVTDMLPSRSLFWLAGALGLLVGNQFGWEQGLLFAAGFSIWGSAGWGLWFDLGRWDAEQADDKRHNDPFVRVIHAISFGSDHLALFWRHFLLILPMLVGQWVLSGNLAYMALAVPFAALVVAAYELGHRISRTIPITFAELITGAIWWAFCFVLFYGYPL